MSASQNNITLNLLQSDSLGVAVLSRAINVAFAGAVGEFIVGSLASGANSITLPISPTLQLYIKNLHATNTITVTWTPTGGASVVAIVLGPGAEISFWFPTTAGTYGISVLSLNASGAGTPFEMFLGG